MLCSIIPPHVLRSIAARGDDDDRMRAIAALELSSAPRSERRAVALVAGELTLLPRRKRRAVFDAQRGRRLPGIHARAEGSRRVADADVNDAYDGAGRTYDFFRRVYGRFSVDDRGMRLDCSVHFGNAFNNAHWDGRQVICGDGDGKYFRRFAASTDIIAHELTHGVTQYAAGLRFSGQCGALAEHFCDVFAVLVRQYWRGETADAADWLVGADLFTERVNGSGIRSLRAPGTAYDDPILGRDPQPSHMRNYVKTRSDDGGVHINSGIPNHAFYRVATLLGGRAWEIAGRIWYRALTHHLSPRARFQQCADATWRAAGELYGGGSEPQTAVREAWSGVGIDLSPALRSGTAPLPARPVVPLFDPPAAAAEVPQFA